MKLRMATTWLVVSLTIGMAANIGRANEPPGDREPTGEQSSVDDLKYAPAAWPEAPDTGTMLRRLVLGTATVLGLCICTLWGGRRWIRGAPVRANSGSVLRLIETVSLGNRCAVHLIRAGDHQVLVGVDGAGVKSLVPLPPSFEQAVADAGLPPVEPALNFEGGQMSAA